jgi:predicted DNA-binding transcriptional regulator YafY
VRADRLVAIVLLLQARGRLTAPELAARLEVSVRTVYRDLDALSAAGVPVYATTGRNGGIVLPEGYRLDLTALRPAEARALFLGGAPGSLADLGVGAVLDGALRKLSAALPASTRDEAERARQRLLVDGTDWWQAPRDPPPHLRTVEAAVWGDRRLRLAYARYGREATERVVDPYGLVAKRGVWYLVGAVVRTAGGEAGAPAAFRVSRIRAAELLDEPSQRPVDFDLGRFWSEFGAAFLASVPSYPATLRATPRAGARLARVFVKGTAPPPLGEPDVAGRVTLRVDLETLEVASATVLEWGPEVEVLAPPELRRRVAELTAAAAAQYAPRPS